MGGRRAAPAGSSKDWHQKGLAAYAAHDYAQAIDCLERAIALTPGAAWRHSQLGVVFRAAGRLSDAIAAHRHAIALDPGIAAFHNNLGNALRAAGEFAAAEAALREALRLKPDYAEPYCNLGQLLRRCNRVAEGEAMFRRAVELRPDYAEALCGLGQICASRADFIGAERFFGAACKARPTESEIFIEFGAALEGLGRFEEADRAYDRAMALAPDQASTNFARARRHEQRGDAAAAEKHYRQALERQPRLANAYLGLSNLSGEGLGVQDKAEIRRLLDLPDLADEERSSLLYALARTFERERCWDEAFQWARRANEVDHARTAFNETDNLYFIRRTVAAFPEGFAASQPAGSLSERPVFIVGMPRSGTTLVEQIIASHQMAAAGGEMVDIPEMADEFAANSGPQRGYPECVRQVDEPVVRSLAQRYLARLDQISTSAVRVTDKLPFNFRHLGLITALFPKARIVHCRRDPRDIAVSCYFTKFHRPISFACDLFEMGAYLRQYEVLMAHWRRVLPRMLDVEYENVVADFEYEARRLIDFCDLPWDEGVLRFHETGRTVRTASANQVRRPIYASSVGRWQRYGRYLLPLYAELEGRSALRPRSAGSESARQSARPRQPQSDVAEMA